MATSNPQNELSNFTAYAVVDQAANVVSVTDTFASAIEAAEGHATATFQEKDNTTETMAVLAAESELAPQTQGYYGRWVNFDEKAGEAELQVFFLRVKPDGFVFAGSRQERLQQTVKVKPTTVDLFDGYMVSYDGGDEIENDASNSSDEGSDDETYVARD